MCFREGEVSSGERQRESYREGCVTERVMCDCEGEEKVCYGHVL